ncbi:MAG: hypothetical protein NT092_10000 [Bacteroidia bacterium]|nr:hypothetical protein [Bacteroidia bacterium]
MRLKTTLKINRILAIVLIFVMAAGCKDRNNPARRIAIAKAGDAVLYLDRIPSLVKAGTSATDSTAIVQDYINKWARKELMFQKAEENLSPELKEEIDSQLEETRSDLTIYQYQRQMMLEKMDTIISDVEMENYYISNSQHFILGYNIVKALFIKLPFETPNLSKIRMLARSNVQKDFQELETICYQFADRFDDFNEQWIPLDRISLELPRKIDNEEYFLRRSSFYESTDSIDMYFLKILDFKLKSTPAPFEYVSEDIKRTIWNTRRIEFIQNLENGIYNNATEENRFTLFNNK